MSVEPGAGDEADAVAARPLVVVGVSARTGSPTALRWAVEEAAHRGGHVRAVLAWRPPRAPGVSSGRPPAVPTTAPEDPQRVAEERVRSVVEEALGPEHAVECVAVQGAPRAVLLRQSQGATVLVLDSPRSSKLSTPGAKLLAPQLVFASACPVVVMPPPVEEGLSKARRATQRLGRAAAAAAASAGRPGLPPRLRPDGD
ncbi:universal stress protein [Kineococcus rubinsiae]|uniref:universal stress protein n=1 Tax=Kineococcus rubinsiae TaxID=2609562 RepID=UPI001431CA4B|nr:universal stress protein [Kineococcus rubinsiae]NIZ92155.1 universal stress protein [Kineococcus rubinsiae]